MNGIVSMVFGLNKAIREKWYPDVCENRDDFGQTVHMHSLTKVIPVRNNTL